MKYIDEFKDKRVVQAVVKKIKGVSHALADNRRQPVVLMEVCGTHTMALFKTGIRSLLDETIKIVAGPGCPVCVTSQDSIDRAIALAEYAVIATYGDMVRVPGTKTSLEKARAQGAEVLVVYSALDALGFARDNPHKEVVFLGVGFETTTPPTAATILQAQEQGVTNFTVLSFHRLIPPALELLSQGPMRIDGYLCPGHVSSIIGEIPYAVIASKYKIPCVISGFEPLDILEGIYLLLKQIEEGRSEVENAYTRVVKRQGNIVARTIVERVFELAHARWRGIGIIPQSGLIIKEVYRNFDAEKKFDIVVEESKSHPGCLCGEVLKGLITPRECRHFGKTCTPQEPLGPCMVSSEGTCAAYYRYGGLY